MMKSLETSDQKIEEICKQIRLDTLEPAKMEAERIVSEAKRRADEMLLDAEKKVAEMLSDAKKERQREESVFQSTMKMAGKLSVEALRQAIEERFFFEAIDDEVRKTFTKPDVVAKLLQKLVEEIVEKGLSTDLEIFLSKNIDKEEITQFFAKSFLESIENVPFVIKDFGGGFQISMRDKNVTFDLSDQAVSDLMLRFIPRLDFRKLLFQRDINE